MALQKDIEKIEKLLEEKETISVSWKKWKSHLAGGQKTYHVGKRKDRLL